MVKTYLLDTSVVIDSVDNIKVLSENGKNKILITDVVLSEADNLKSNLGSVGYMARRFNNFLQDGEVYEVIKEDGVIITKLKAGEVFIDLINKDNYKEGFSNNYQSVVNDRRIIESAVWASTYYENLIVVSNDLAFRTYAISKALKTRTLKVTEKDILDIEFIKEIEIDYAYLEKLDLLDLEVLKRDFGVELLPNEVNIVFKLKNSNHEVLANVINNKIDILNEDKLRDIKLPPRNKEQLFFVNMILNIGFDIILSSSPSGSGKTALSLACALKLVDNPKNSYEKIVYLRNPIDSVDKDAYIGFKKGDLEDKLSGYFTPIYDALETFARLSLKRSKQEPTRDLLELKVEEFIKKYNITFPYIGNLRGSNLSQSVVIIDEAQNFSLSSMQLVLTRISDSSKVIVIGDINQVDSIYLSKQNNALSFLLNETRKQSNEVKLGAITLNKSIRGNICQWAEELFSEHKYY